MRKPAQTLHKFAQTGHGGYDIPVCRQDVREMLELVGVEDCWQVFYVYPLMAKPEIADENSQEKITKAPSGPPVIRLTNPSPADKEEEEQEDENRRRWLLFEAQRVGMAEGLHKPDADKKK